MKEIKLSRGKVALVDDIDFNTINKYNWNAAYRSGKYYAQRKEGDKHIYMHRQIMGATDRKDIIDHKDGDGLNNQRTNIRRCTFSENQKNKKPSGTSKYLGVNLHGGRWRAGITYNGKCYHLGLFKNEVDAAKEYDKAAIINHGEFANINFK